MKSLSINYLLNIILTKISVSSDSKSQEPRLYRHIADSIVELISEERIPVGARLPSVRDLSARLNVSRTSLREALLALEIGGILEVRGGSGVYVSDNHEARSALSETGPGPFEVLASRLLIESEVAAIAARVATAGAIDVILNAVLEMERHHADYASNEQADRNFHVAIARATGNSALVGVIEYLWDQRGRLWGKLKEHFQTEEMRQQTLTDHRRVLEAIAAHDPAGARRAMRAHLEYVTRTFSRG